MTIITKGMGAIIKKYARTVSSLKKSGKTFKIKDETIDKKGRVRKNTRYVSGPVKDFTYKPKMPRKRGQGKLFGEKFEKAKKDPKQLVLPGLKKGRFGPISPEKKIKRLSKKAEVK